MSEIPYQCVKCGGQMTQQDIVDRGGQAKCIHCGYRAIKKIKPPVVKRVEAI